MTEVVEDLVQLAVGSHRLSSHEDPEEAADHAVRLFTDTPEGTRPPSSVNDEQLAA